MKARSQSLDNAVDARSLFSQTPYGFAQLARPEIRQEEIWRFSIASRKPVKRPNDAPMQLVEEDVFIS
jgi:hypothetical protein